MHVERHADRHAGRDAAQPRQQFALAVVVALGDHRAVQVEQHRVAAGGHRVADPAGHVLEGGIVAPGRWARRCPRPAA